MCTKTLRRWEQLRRFLPACRTAGNHRRYSTADLQVFIRGSAGEPRETVVLDRERTGESPGRVNRSLSLVPQRVVCYARVSSSKQRRDLERQVAVLMDYCSRQGYQVVAVYKDTASGLNDRRAGLLRLLDTVIAGRVDRVVVTYPDRLARFGTGFIERVFVNHGAVLETVTSTMPSATTVQPGGAVDPYRLLVDDMVALVTSFAGKIHRLRRGKRHGRAVSLSGLSSTVTGGG